MLSHVSFAVCRILKILTEYTCSSARACPVSDAAARQMLPDTLPACTSVRGACVSSQLCLLGGPACLEGAWLVCQGGLLGSTLILLRVGCVVVSACLSASGFTALGQCCLLQRTM